ncbi:hypothetical protein CMV_018768 [Castanea mollissima]|uniref:Uncharacterized protein n=1 Tax=Castanea mollissima TaxID=60419 RepID=A0A8J4QZI5_9ROSI|nr:hypothetical protein CMV_018768 [Castanea mollissima]
MPRLTTEMTITALGLLVELMNFKMQCMGCFHKWTLHWLHTVTRLLPKLGSTVSRASARLHNVHQLEVNLDQSYDGALMKRPKRNADIATLATASTVEDKSRHHQDSQLQAKSSKEPDQIDDINNPERPETSSADGNQHETSAEDVIMSDGDNISNQVESVKLLFVEHTASYNIPQLERLYTRIMKGVFETKAKVKDDLKPSILKYLLKFAEDEANF